MEASVDHMAREASSVRRYPSSLPSRAAWSCLTEGSGLSGMVRSTLHADWTCRQSEIPAFFDQTVQFPGQQGEPADSASELIGLLCASIGTSSPSSPRT